MSPDKVIEEFGSFSNKFWRVFCRMSRVKKCQKSRQILKSSGSSSMFVNWIMYHSEVRVKFLRASMFEF